MIHVVTWMHGDLHIRRHVVVVAIVRLSERSFCARTWLEHHFYIVIAARGTGMRPLEVSLLRPEGFLRLKLASFTSLKLIRSPPGDRLCQSGRSCDRIQPSKGLRVLREMRLKKIKHRTSVFEQLKSLEHVQNCLCHQGKGVV